MLIPNPEILIVFLTIVLLKGLYVKIEHILHKIRGKGVIHAVISHDSQLTSSVILFTFLKHYNMNNLGNQSTFSAVKVAIIA